MSTSIKTLSSFTGMSEVELQRRAQELATAGQIKGLSALEKALLVQTSGPNTKTADAFSAMGAQSQEPHALEEPITTLSRGTAHADAGFAAAPAQASLTSQVAPAVVDAAANAGQKRMGGFFSVSSPGQVGGAKNDGKTAFEAINSMISEIDIAGIQSGDEGSRDLAFEKLKLSMQRISQGMQALTNTLNQNHETAKTAINNLRA
jgi:hypothetical protein